MVFTYLHVPRKCEAWIKSIIWVVASCSCRFLCWYWIKEIENEYQILFEKQVYYVPFYWHNENKCTWKIRSKVTLYSKTNKQTNKQKPVLEYRRWSDWWQPTQPPSGSYSPHVTGRQWCRAGAWRLLLPEGIWWLAQQHCVSLITWRGLQLLGVMRDFPRGNLRNQKIIVTFACIGWELVEARIWSDY